MKDKVVLITGAAMGMGLAGARIFAGHGASVVMADINEKAVNEAADNLRAIGHEVTPVVCDVTDENQVRQMVEKTVAVYGHLDYAYNNAGIIIPPSETSEIDIANFDRIMNINLKGTWLCMKYELKEMCRHNFGAIVNVSSIAGVEGSYNRSAYAATKHGVIGLTRSAAIEYATRGIRVNAVCPGTIKTPMLTDMLKKGEIDGQMALDVIPMHRFAEAEEVASVAFFLCSDGASFITGQAIVVDGGQTIK